MITRTHSSQIKFRSQIISRSQFSLWSRDSTSYYDHVCTVQMTPTPSSQWLVSCHNIIDVLLNTITVSSTSRDEGTEHVIHSVLKETSSTMKDNESLYSESYSGLYESRVQYDALIRWPDRTISFVILDTSNKLQMSLHNLCHNYKMRFKILLYYK